MSDRQLTQQDLAGMTPQQITSAHESGQLDALLGVRTSDVEILDKARATTEPLTPHDLVELGRLGRHDLIAEAFDANRITYPNQGV